LNYVAQKNADQIFTDRSRYFSILRRIIHWRLPSIAQPS
jgi:hypothetical protein